MSEDLEKHAALERMRKGLVDFEEESIKSFEVRAVKGVARLYDLKVPRRYEDIELGWLNENLNTSVIFGAKRVKVDVVRLFTGITRTPGFKAYLDFMADNGFARSALIVPWKGQGLYVLHNCWRLPAAPGHTRIVRPASTSEKGTVFESLKAFCSAARMEGL